jgi:hypothetical protein
MVLYEYDTHVHISIYIPLDFFCFIRWDPGLV